MKESKSGDAGRAQISVAALACFSLIFLSCALRRCCVFSRRWKHSATTVTTTATTIRFSVFPYGSRSTSGICFESKAKASEKNENIKQRKTEKATPLPTAPRCMCLCGVVCVCLWAYRLSVCKWSRTYGRKGSENSAKRPSNNNNNKIGKKTGPKRDRPDQFQKAPISRLFVLCVVVSVWAATTTAAEATKTTSSDHIRWKRPFFKERKAMRERAIRIINYTLL